jgi:lipopolysaccharide/colanic/teichoic acid biosynthesis glycosyltransferase
MGDIMYNCPEPNVSRYFQWKRYVDFPIALFLAIIALPIIGFAWVLVRITSRGPGFYRQVRLGLDGKPFTIYKLRSMRIDAEVATGAVWAARKDKRITFIGKILRQSHIDELPQIYNVLRGEMDLVGPRPERPEFVSELEKRIDGYAYRLYVRPGVTGLAQLNQDSDIDLNDVRRKLVFDFDYLEHASIGFDMRLLFCTSLKAVFLCRPAILKLFRLYREASHSHWTAALFPTVYASPGDEDRLSKILVKRTTV